MAEVLRETFDSTAMTTFWLGVMKNPSHAKLAKERLAMLGPIAATPVLNAMRSGSVSSVKDDDGIAILAELRDPSVLVPFLTDPDLKVRKAVATVLSRKADDRFNTPLAQVLATEKDASIRVVAASGLVGASAAEALTKALSDLDVGVRLASIEGLAKAGDSQALSKAAKQDKDPKVRAAAVQAFARVKNPPTDSLLLALNDPDSGVKRAAAEVLGGLTDKTAVRPLIVAMQGQPISTRRAISETLKKLTGEDLGMDQQAWTKWWQGQPKN